MLCAKLGWNWPCFSGEEENVKSLQQRRQTMTKLWSEKLTWAFDSGEQKTTTTTNKFGSEKLTWNLDSGELPMKTDHVVVRCKYDITEWLFSVIYSIKITPFHYVLPDMTYPRVTLLIISNYIIPFLLQVQSLPLINFGKMSPYIIVTLALISMFIQVWKKEF